ncbi:MAG TPA: IS256 family transposase [Acidimicrobiales bacterium]|nr:IS256 family transposase [Acidimicrobiales bacterium]
MDELFASDRDLASTLEEVARLSVRLMFQAAIEGEVEEFLGRTRYERRGEGDRPGHRNGWQPPTTVKTTMGPVEVSRPKLRDTDEAFCSRLFGTGVTRTNALEALVISGWVRGLSDRDIEAALAEVLGPEAALSRSTVSRICQRIREEFATWSKRDLSGVVLDYLYLDASHFRMHQGARAEPVLVAWGIDTLGKPVFIALAGAAAESTDAWDDFLADLKERGLKAPLLGITDGAPGLTGGFDRAFPASLRQRCLIHRARNILSKVSAPDQEEVKADYWAIFEVGDAAPGEEAVGVARAHAEAFATKWGKTYPGAVACVTEDLASLTVHLRFPAEHWSRIRHSNLLERTFGESRRRVKVIGRLPGEVSCLSLVWAVLDRASRGWRGLTMTPAAIRHLQDLRRQLLHPPATEEVVTEAVTPAA